MTFHGIASATLLAMALAGCASWVPDPEPFPPSTQLVSKSARHWLQMADDVAAKVQDASQRTSASVIRPIHVAAYSPGSAFDSAFRNMLITRLVERGLVVSDDPKGAVRLEYRTQVVGHGSPRHAPRHEVVLSSSMEADGRFIMRATDVYYVKAADAGLFVRRGSPPLRKYSVVGAGR